MKKIISLMVLLGLAACAGMEDNESGASKAADNMNFYQHWVHAYEEQGGQKTPHIFRPAGSQQFPPSRFRMEFGFNPNGECSYKYLSPDDRHEMRHCIYTKIGNKVYIYDDAGVLLKHLSFTLVEPPSRNRLLMTYGVQSVTAKKIQK